MTTGTTLLLVDVQKDFHPGGSLAIPTADEDAVRIARLIRTHGSKISKIVATMDSHHRLHIAHPGFWWSCSDLKKHPKPFTIITSQDIIDGKWMPRDDLVLKPNVLDSAFFTDIESVIDEVTGEIDLLKYAIEYTRRLEEKGRFKLCIWPEHCLIGSTGHGVVNSVREAMQEWEEQSGGSIDWVWKGENQLTENYSALQAEVPVTKETSFDQDLLDSMVKSDRLLVCGQAMSHCVNYTLRHIVERWPADSVSKISLLTDCTSAVPGFEATAAIFMKDMKNAGVKLQGADEVFSLTDISNLM